MERSQNELMNMINSASMGFHNSFSDQIPATFSLQNIFDMPLPGSDHDQNNAMSFLESYFLSEDYTGGNSLFDPPLLNTTPPPPPPTTTTPPPSQPLPGSTEVVYTPVTPNSSSLSLSSDEAVNDEQLPKSAEEAEEENQDESKNLVKPKRKNQKKERQQRFAFLVMAEADQLDDGYRWRKYGQKAVKNSPFPRSYYRCTTPACGVKKRIERSHEDPSMVVTTYEGRHTHPVPVPSRSATNTIGFNMPETLLGGGTTLLGGGSSSGSGSGGCGGGGIGINMGRGSINSYFLMPNHNHLYSPVLQQQPPYLPTAPLPYNIPPSTNIPPLNPSNNLPQQRRFVASSSSSSWVRDEGNLLDMVPFHLRKPAQ